jgi:hypothetical protein
MYFLRKSSISRKIRGLEKSFFLQKVRFRYGQKNCARIKKNLFYPYGDINFVPYNPWVNLPRLYLSLGGVWQQILLSRFRAGRGYQMQKELLKSDLAISRKCFFKLDTPN